MVYGDREEREMFSDENGSTGTINIYCDWADVDPIYDPVGYGLPKYGDLWPGSDINLRCISVRMERYAIDRCKLQASYSTDGQITDDFMSVEFGVGMTALECSLGWKWQFGETPNDELDSPPEKAMLYQVPVGTMSVKLKRSVTRAELNVLMNQVGKISSDAFMGFVKGGVRLDGIETSEGYANDGSLKDATISYKFSVRGMDWRYMWHNPEIAVDINTGREIYWQNTIWLDDDGNVMANFTPNGTVNPDPVQYPSWPASDTTKPKPGTPMWIQDIRGGYIDIEIPGDPPITVREYGWGAWYMPYFKDAANQPHYLYETCDFTAVLGIPVTYPPEVA